MFSAKQVLIRGRTTKIAVSAFFLVALTDCGLAKLHSASQPQLVKRASFELGCAPQNLEITELGLNRGVSGCGRRAVYVERCDGDPRGLTTSCDWALNGVSEPPAAARAAPATSSVTPAAAPSLPASSVSTGRTGI